MSIESKKTKSLSDFIYRIRSHPDFRQAFVHLKHIPAVEADYGEELYLTEELAGILRRNKIERLYSHQKEAIEKIKMLSLPHRLPAGKASFITSPYLRD